MAVPIAALALAGLEAANLLMRQFPDYDQRKLEEFEGYYDEYNLQKTMPNDHPDRNDDLLFRLRHKLFEHVQEINAHARARSKASKSLSDK